MQPASIDDPKYYWRNACLLFDWVYERYQGLCTPGEQAFFDAWYQLPNDEQALLVRMLSRKGEYFRCRQLNYEEIGTVDWSNLALTRLGLIALDPVMASQQMATLATVSELSQWVRKARKPQMIEAFCQAYPQEQAWSVFWPTQPLVALRCQDAFDQIRLKFFGNLRQSLSDFIFAELGVQARLPIDLERLSNAFRSQRQIADAWRTHQLGQAIDEERVDLAWLEDIPDSPDWLRQRYLRRLFQLGQLYERQQNIADALACYQAAQTPAASIRQLRLLERHEHFQQATELCQAMLASPRTVTEQQASENVAKRLAKKGWLAFSAPAKPAIGKQTLVLEQAPEHLEYQVAQALNGEVYYCENALWQALLFITFAPAILAPVEGAFFHPFQRSPMDLLSERFCQRRPVQMAAGWALLDSERWPQVVSERWQSPSMQAVLALAPPIDMAVAKRAMAVLPRALFRQVFERMWFDLAANRTGFPDLLQLTPQAKVLEVKGPSDRLQAHQSAWLRVFARHIEAVELRVSWPS